MFCPLRALRPALPLAQPSILFCAMPFILCCCSNCRAHQSLCSPFPSLPCPALCSTLPPFCNHLYFYLLSALPSTQLRPYPVPILTPDLRPPSVASSNMSLLRHLCPILLHSLSRYPSHSPLSLSCPPLRLTHACPSPCPSCPLSSFACCHPPCPFRSYNPAPPFVQASAYP